MEFLMSYGWALLVVLLVIAALAYFGMLNPDRFLPDKVTVSDNRIQIIPTQSNRLIIKNNGGDALNNLQINMTNHDCVSSTTQTIPPGEFRSFMLMCKDVPTDGGRLKGDIKINYTSYTYGETMTKNANAFYGVRGNYFSTRDIKGYWPMDNDEKDNSGNGLGGTIVGTGVISATGKVNRGYSFSGATGNYISINLGEDIGNSFTMAAWFNPRTMPAAGDFWQGIVANAASNGDHGIWTYNLNRMDYFADGVQHSSSTTISTNRWYHAAITYDGTNGRLYINGVLDSNYPIAMAKDAITTIYIANSGWANELFDGVIDEVVVFKRALSKDEIKALYASGTS
jgi:hypothetical protein